MRDTRLAAAAACLLAAIACSRGDTAPGTAKHGEGVRRMAARLETIAREANIRENPWRNTERAEDLRGMVEQAIASKEYLELAPNFGGELLKAGRTEEAIQQFLKLQDFSTQGGTSELSRDNRTFLRHHLAISYLRLGEQENCQLHHNTESCLMPIRGGGIHARREGSEKAMQVLLTQMKENPRDQSARWWMNIAAMTLGEYPDGLPKRSLIPPKGSVPKIPITIGESGCAKEVDGHSTNFAKL